ncbi:lipoxygenase homology domain-containing protein 1-like isoform X3 [Physella acuta]|uniref:lipoxygenase homology domain-containing protein 1-like isoform X3 n=1 Tax=Physella acuta TaxID=109671 RepID=UPI0027DD02C6|nr:lipoxygenase homology domain-containing protein 1-like isoform X3 [Physella acuta]
MSYVTVFGLLCLAMSIQAGSTKDIPYYITIKTGHKLAAGTDAKVFIQLNGPKGTTGRIVLEEQNSKSFEKGSVDQFTVMGPDVGQVTSIEIGHDNSGIGPGWFLDSVEVVQVQNKLSDKPSFIKTRFDLNNWIPGDEKSKTPFKKIKATSTETKPI